MTDKEVVDKINQNSKSHHALQILYSLKSSKGPPPSDKAVFRVLRNIFGRERSIDAFRQYYLVKTNKEI